MFNGRFEGPQDSVRRTIVFETRAYISYNSKFVYCWGRFIGWLAQEIKASSGIAFS
jgi:hypothetical protein